MKVRIVFGSPLRLEQATLTEATVEADRIVHENGRLSTLHRGEVTLAMAAGDVAEVDLTQITAQAARDRSERLAAVKQRYPNHGKHWSEEDVELLTRLWGDGVKVPELMERFARNRSGILSRLEQLGLI
jgi:hypothetical protein